RNAVYKGKELVKPDIGFDGNMTLYFGGLTFQITAEGRGHSTGDLTVYIPQKRVFLMGDLLDTEVHPGQGESGDIFYSNVKGWIEILDRIMARHLPVDTYVPGHGPVHIGRGIKDLEEQKRYFIVMRDEVAKMITTDKILYTGAKAEGKITWYTSLAGESYKQLYGAFEARYPGVKVETYRATRQEMGARILAEAQAQRHIVDTLETTIPLLKLLKDNNMLVPYHFSAQAKYPDKVKEKGPKGLVFWAIDRESHIGLAYNRNAILDMLAPKY